MFAWRNWFEQDSRMRRLLSTAPPPGSGAVWPPAILWMRRSWGQVAESVSHLPWPDMGRMAVLAWWGEKTTDYSSFTPSEQWKEVPVPPTPMHLFGSMLPMCILILISPVSARKRHTPLLAGCLRCCTLLASFCCKVRLKTHNAHMAEH